MDIKLRARLSAYSKVDALHKDCEGDVITHEEIDTLFEDLGKPQAVTNKEIDKLFIDSTAAESDTVTFDEIDLLFK